MVFILVRNLITFAYLRKEISSPVGIIHCKNPEKEGDSGLAGGIPIQSLGISVFVS